MELDRSSRSKDLESSLNNIFIAGIVDIQSGFFGHNNDSGQFYMIPRIGPEEELHLPHGLYILADKGHPEQ
jgi:hypothetical protein